MALPFPQPTTLLSSSPSFAISQPTEADVNAMVEVYYESFQTDPRNTYWWSRDRAAQVAWLRRRIQSKQRDPGARSFKVVDTSNNDEVVAWARWHVPTGTAGTGPGAFGINASALDDSKQEHEPEKNKAQPDATSGGAAAAAAAAALLSKIGTPSGTDPAVIEHFFQAMIDMSQKWNSSENSTLFLEVLCTSPKYFGRGAGKALLTPMLEIADAQGLRTYLEATEAGKPLYEKLGFRQVDVLRFDTKGKGEGGEVLEVAIMIRDPKKAGN